MRENDNFLSSKGTATPPEPRYFLFSFRAFFWTTNKRRLKFRQSRGILLAEGATRTGKAIF
jgi:hypothetical protein